jgi:sarcosine oxidase subunit gamma
VTAELTTATLARRHSPLQHLADRLAATGSAETVMLEELPFRTLVELRVDPDGDGPGRLAGALGVPLPETAGEVTGGGSRQVLWLGPGWWLVTDEPEQTAGLEARLATALRQAEPTGTSVVDVSAQFTTLRLAGEHARTVLEHGCAIDLHPRVFGPGSCAQTVLAKAQVILHHTDRYEYRILVRASFADYLARWLLDAMTEYTAGS